MTPQGDTRLLLRHKLDVGAYHRMAADVFTPEDRVELIEGDLIGMAPISTDHAGCVDELTRLVMRAYGDVAHVAVQNPVHIDRFNEPQPDVALARPRPDRYRASRPGPTDLLLVIEVAVSSLRFDRAVKLPIYARAGVPEVWIVDLVGRQVEVYRTPTGNGYAEMTTKGPADTVAPVLLPEIRLELATVFAEN